MTTYRKSFPEGTRADVLVVLRTAENKDVLRRAQAIYCRAAHNMALSQIAEITGYTVSTIRKLHSLFLREGMGMFDLCGRGGRRNNLMTPAEEAIFLEPFIKAGDEGGILEVSAIHRALCKKSGRRVYLSTTYDLLHRHGWRKIMPRSRHPRADQEAQAAFKKMACSRRDGL